MTPKFPVGNVFLEPVSTMHRARASLRPGPGSSLNPHGSLECEQLSGEPSGVIPGPAGVEHGYVGRKQKAIISRGSIMAAGQIGKVPGAPPTYPSDARSRETKRRGKKVHLRKQM